MLTTQELCKKFHGLNASEVAASRKNNGSNSLTKGKKKGFFRQFLSNFGDPIIKILLLALGVNIVMMLRSADWFESVGIAVAIFIATFVSTLSEYGSEAAFEKMQEEASHITCRVLRHEGIVSIPIEEVVVGDYALLQGGERVPADGVIVSGEILINQAALNGESKEAPKKPGSLSEKWDLSCPSQIFRGSIAADGECIFQVCRVGDQTLYGDMAREMQVDTRESPLRVRLSHLAKIISRIGYVAAILVALADLFHSICMDNNMNLTLIKAAMQDWSWLFGHLLHALTLAVTVVVMAVPEGLPMMITIVLSSNMRRMLKDNVLVRKLVGIETSGSLNILFSDKTGTMTKGLLQVCSFVSGDGKEYDSPERLKRSPKLYEKVLVSGVYNTASRVSGSVASGGNATDRALLDWILPLPADYPSYVSAKKVSFDSSRKFSAIQLKGKNSSFTMVKGAPERILDACRYFYSGDGKILPLQNLAHIRAKWTSMTNQGMRVLALAMSRNTVTEQGKFENLILLGLVGILDNLRPEAKKAVRDVERAGIQVVMITGDNKNTALAIGARLGLIHPGEKDAVFTSQELAEMTDRQISEKLSKMRIVARALPSDKSRLVRIAQEAGLVAGMTGDGMNDAPALKKADVGFAMGSGTEVAKEAGDIVILDNNIASIAKAVLYGRTIFKSIQKFIVYQLTMNFCAVGVSIIGPFIGIDTPVTVMQMLWLNIIMDTLSGMAFSGEPPLREYMLEPPKRRDEPLLSRPMAQQIIFGTIFITALCVLFLCSDHLKGTMGYAANELPFMTAFFTLFVFCGVFNSFNTRTPRINLFANLRRNRLFAFIMVSVLVMQVIFVYFGGTLFRTTGLTMDQMKLIVLLAFLVLPADILRKIITRNKRNQKHRSNALQGRLS